MLLAQIPGLDYIESVEIPREIPVMILPRCILFPQAMLPLHIFEQRYRRMLKDSLATHRMFCIGTIRRGKEGDEDENQGIYDILGVGLIRVAVGKPDGTSNLILQGICRARIVDLIGGKPYQRAHVEPLISIGGNNITVEALAAKVTELAKVRANLGTTVPENALKYLITLNDPETLSDLVTFTLLEDCHEKQSVLETLDLRVRLKKVIVLLQTEIYRLKILQDLKKGLDDDKTKLN